MTWYYNSRTGEISHPLTGTVGIGYSGTGLGRDNPDMENQKEVGPCPRGRYIIGPVYNHIKLGPLVMNLNPVDHDAFGRTAFRIHGDNKKNDASNGCIVLSRKIRQMISDSNDHELIVHG